MSKHPHDFSVDAEVKGDIRDELEKLVKLHGLPTVFWSLDSVYDEFDERMTEAVSKHREERD